MYVYIYIYIYNYICQSGGTVGFFDFTKLSFALSSLAQPFDQMGSIPKYIFVLLTMQEVFEKKQLEKVQVR